MNVAMYAFSMSVLLFYGRSIGWFRMDTCHYSPLYNSRYIGSLIDFSIHVLVSVQVCVCVCVGGRPQRSQEF